MFRFIVAVFLVLAIASSKSLAALPEDRSAWTFYLDNDYLSPGGGDGLYSSSLAATHTGLEPSDLFFSLHQIFGLNGHPLPGTEQFVSSEIGLSIFTPLEIEKTTYTYGDRPYANLVHVDTARHRYFRDRELAQSTSLTIGLLGSNIGPAIQREFHDWTHSDEPKGWNQQISDGGELTFRFREDYRRLIAEEKGARVILGYGYGVGYITDVTVSLNGMIGHTSLPWWTASGSPTTFGARGLPIRTENGGTRLFWWEIQLRYELYNALVQGQFRDSALTYDRDELHAFQPQIAIGYAWGEGHGRIYSLFLRVQRNTIAVGSDKGHEMAWGGIIVSF